MFDLTNRKSFENVKNWVEELPGLTKCDTIIMIVGSKKDLIDQNPQARAVSTDELRALAGEKRCLYRETSAYYDQNNISETFTDIVRGSLGFTEKYWTKKITIQAIETTRAVWVTASPKKSKKK